MPDRPTKFWELPASEREPLENAFSAWHGKWDHALALGGLGDLLELRDALNAAFPNDCKSS
jgi:hypothetical protein